MSEVILAINRMESDGIVGGYAIGGAVAAAFYIESVSTIDVDIFVTFTQPGPLISLEPVFSYLKDLGCSMQDEYVLIGGWPVQFLPPINALVEEAMLQFRRISVEGVMAKVFSAEHLAAIALQTRRSKDLHRLQDFLDSGVLDLVLFVEILTRHGLLESWEKFRSQH